MQRANLGVGCILRLPDNTLENRSENILCETTSCPPGCHLEEQGYAHPLVILHIFAGPNPDILFAKVR